MKLLTFEVSDLEKVGWLLFCYLFIPFYLSFSKILGRENIRNFVTKSGYLGCVGREAHLLELYIGM